MAYEKELAHLRKLTTTENDFSIPTTYFLDHIAEDLAIGRHSKVLEDNKDFYKALLKPVTQQYFHGTVKILGSYLMEIENQQFVHGAISLSNGSIVALYFFTDIQLGMAAIPSMSGKTDYFRLNTFTDEREEGNAGITLETASTTQH